jgi:hypothetical protein
MRETGQNLEGKLNTFLDPLVNGSFVYCFSSADSPPSQAIRPNSPTGSILKGKVKPVEINGQG